MKLEWNMGFPVSALKEAGEVMSVINIYDSKN